MNQNWIEAHKEFPVNKHSIWLNNCGTTPISSKSLKAVHSFLEGYSKAGVFTDVANYRQVKNNIKNILSQLLNCDPLELCLIHNTSEGMNYISHSLKLPENSKILLLENEYPSNYYPWEHWKEKKMEIVTLPMAQNTEEWLDNVEKALKQNISLVSLSPVHWCTGQVLPIEEIGSMCKKAGAYFALDGSQAVGAVPVDLKKAKVDFMAMAAWKWLLGPLGLGVMYVSISNLDKLTPVFKGTASVEGAEEYLPYKSKWKQGADRFEISTPNFNDWIYFESSLGLLNNIGFSHVLKRLSELSRYLESGLLERGYRLAADSSDIEKSPIVSFNKANKNMEQLSRQLTKHKIIHALRLGKIRFGPHVYILESQLDQVFDILDEWEKSSASNA